MTTQPNIEQKPNPFPDNIFFENEAGEPQGASWNGEIEDIRATYGTIAPNISTLHYIPSPEIVVTHSGKAHVMSEYDLANEGQPFARGMTLEQDRALFLPVGQIFRLETVSDETLVYTCFYPRNHAEMWSKLIMEVIPRTYGVPTCLPPYDWFWDYEQWDGETYEKS